MILPREITPARTDGPRFSIFFGKPKTGKTSAFCKLKNHLLIDIEDGSDFVDACKIKIDTIGKLFDLIAEIKKANAEVGGYVYDYIILDSGTALEDMILPYAAKLYKDTEMGKKWGFDRNGEPIKGFHNDVRRLPQGAGWLYLREAYLDVLDRLRAISKSFILLCHSADTQIDVDGEEMSEVSVALSGKLKSIVPSKADAIGYIYKKKNETIVNFNNGDSSAGGGRCDYLRNKKFSIITSDPEDESDSSKFVFNVDRIFNPELGRLLAA